METMTNKKYFEGKYREATKEYIKKIEEETKYPHYVEILDKKFVVFSTVFSPKYFKDTEFFVKELPIKKGEIFLEIGCGTGIVSIFAILNGASNVVAIDINQNAVENARHNAELYGVGNKIKVLQGDLFEPLVEEKFDTIFWNTPWGLIKEENLSHIEKSLWDTEYKSTKKFIEQAKNHLRENGRILIGFSSTVGDLNYLLSILKDNRYKARIIKETVSKSVNFSSKFEIIEARMDN